MSELKLYDFQREDVDRVKSVLSKHKAVLIASEMGVGKTCQAITAATEMNCKDVLVLCPASVRSVWEGELERWAGKSCNVPEPIDPGGPVAGWNVLTAPTFANKKHTAFRERSWELIIVDEAHAGGFKGYMPTEASSSKAGWAFFSHGGMADRAKKILFLTGTPVPNYIKELWPMASVLLPNDRNFRARGAFVWRYCGIREGRFGQDDRGSSNLDELRNKMRPLIIRRRKSQVLSELPKKTIRVIELPSTSDIRRALNYDTGEIETSRDSIEEIRRRMADAKETNSIADFKAAQGKLKEATAVAHQRLVAIRNTLSVPKAPIVADYVRLLLDGGARKVLVGTWHTAHTDALQAELEPYGVLRIDGGVPSGKRGGIVKEFQEGVPRVMLGQIKAAGTGITLTAATEVVLGEVDFVPGNVAQFCNRCHRPGQTDPVTVHLLCVQHSPDAIVFKSLASKLENIFAAIDGPAKEKRTRTWFGRGADAMRLGSWMSYEQKRWTQRELYGLVKIDKAGKTGDGVGLSSANAVEGRKLALKQVPAPEEYGRMLLMLCKFQKQISGGLPPDVVDLVKRVIDASRVRA